MKPVTYLSHPASCFFCYWHYNPLWVLAFSVILFHSALSFHWFLHRLIPIICISSSISTIHLFLGLPLILVPIGFHSNILLGVSHPATFMKMGPKIFQLQKTPLHEAVSYDLKFRVLDLLKPTGHVMHHQLNIQQLYALPTLYLCVLYLSENKQRLVPLTA